jgi:hypothetical protein
VARIDGMFFEGRTATVREVRTDSEGRLSFAVTMDDDPATELHLAKNRFFYFHADEVDRL